MKNKKTRVLIITYDMIPYAASWGGCQRMYYLAQYLTSLGMKVSVFSCKKNTENYFGNEVDFELQAIELENRWFRTFINSKNVGQKKMAQTKSSYKKQKLVDSMRRKVKSNKFLLDMISSIDSFIYNEPTFMAGPIALSWSGECFNQLVKYIEENSIKNIIISVPAFHLLSLGERLKKKFGTNINLIYDYRDPWNMWKHRSKSCFCREKKYLKYSDRIVCTNELLVKDMAKTFDEDINKFVVVANGYSQDKWSKVVDKEEKKEKMRIAYVGSIEIIYSGIRNIEQFIKAFRRITAEYKDVEVSFIGVNDVSLPKVLELRNEFSNISFVGNVSAVESLEYMKKADVLLLLHTTEDNSSKYIVSGKFYDYVKAGKPILSIGSSNGIHRKYIDEYKLGISVVNNEEQIYEALITMYHDWKENTQTYQKCIDVSEFARETQYKRYMELLV